MEIKVDNFDFNYLRLIDDNGQFEEFNLKEELKVNEDILLEEMLKQPSKYIYWSSLLEKLKWYQEAAELNLEVKVAELDKEAREFITSHGGKPTKDIVEAYIKQQPAYTVEVQQVQYLTYTVGRVARVVKAFEQRKDMLQSYGKQVAEDKQYGRGAGSYIEKTPDQG